MVFTPIINVETKVKKDIGTRKKAEKQRKNRSKDCNLTKIVTRCFFLIESFLGSGRL